MLSLNMTKLEKELNKALKKAIVKQEKKIKENLKKDVINKSTKKTHRCQGYCKIKTLDGRSHVIQRCRKYANKNKKYCENHSNNKNKGVFILRKQQLKM